MTIESTSLLEQIDALKKRGKRFLRYGKWLFGGGLLLAIIAIGEHFAVGHYAPNTILSSIDVPQPILARFSETVGSISAGGLSPPPFRALASTIVDSLPYIVGTVGIIATVGIAAATGDFARALFPMLAGGFVMGVTFFVRPLVGAMSPDADDTVVSSSIKSERDVFLQAVNDKATQTVRKMLGEKSSPADTYVKAQLSLFESPSKLDRSYLQMASSLLSNSPKSLGFTPNGEAAYSIDYAAYGSARSSAAAAYYQNAQREVSEAVQARALFGSTAALSLLIGLGLFGFGRSLDKRVERIEVLSGIKVTSRDSRGSDGKGGLLFSELTDAQQADAQRLFPGVKPDHRFRYTLDESGAVHHREKVSVEETE
ncbi:hypothetical protein [Burkholderia aenigmatica]|uniref:hypothetical protein n=1 Tax=Burkholderia aenigmatica TaxID=2015348 RepID=UPI0026568E11|nr:hypothetical protein [Burkholderia aenigmatica]MDN7880145.1 hypothetical protein [Burkholderia aenigmatica]